MKLTAFTSTFLLAASALAETVLDVSSLPAEEAQSGRGCCVTGVVTMASVWRDRALTLADPGDPNGPALHLKHIFAKLEVADRAEAVSTGISRGIIHV